MKRTSPNDDSSSSSAAKRPRQRVTVREVAKAANVSLGTVSNVLNEPTLVATATRERVLKAIEQTGFVRNTAARELRGAGSKAIGIVVLDSSKPFFTEMIRGAEDALRQDGYVLIACSSDESPEREAQYLRLLEEHRVEGVLITPTTANLARLTKLKDKGVPVVLVDREPEKGELCSVTVDDIKGGRLAVEHLLEHGHTKILLVNGPDSIRQCHDRKLGMLSAIDTVNRLGRDTTLVEIVVPTLSIAAGEEVASTILEHDRSFSAITCANDLLAIGVIRSFHALGINVPKDYSLVGYDDITFSSMISPSLTSVHQPQYDLGFTAAKLLLEELSDDGHHHREIRFTPTLIARESSGRCGPTCRCYRPESRLVEASLIHFPASGRVIDLHVYQRRRRGR